MKSDKVILNFLIPFLFSAGFFFPNGIKTVTLALFFLQVFPLSNWKSIFFSLKKDNLSMVFLAFFLFTTLSYYWSENKSEYTQEVISKVPFLLAPLALFLENKKLEKLLMGLLHGFYWSGIIISLACLIKSAFYSESGTSRENLVYENLAEFSGLQPIYLSLYLIISSLAWYQLFQLNKLPKGWLHFCTPGLFYILVVLLSSRTELMVYSGGLVLVLLRHFLSKKIIFSFLSFGFVVITASIILFSKINSGRFREMLDLRNDYHTNQWGGRSLRLEKWKNAMECYLQFPILGTGAGDCSDELQKVYKKNNFAIAYNAHYNPHNQYIQTLLTLGPIGLILFAAIFGIAFFRAWRYRNFTLLLLTYVFAGSMITESMLERQTGVFLFSVLLPFFASIPKNQHAIPACPDI
jgi:O-antigen ligase